jgi:riboflavin synthase
MFTGIIEEIGTIESVQLKSENYTLMIRATKILDDIHLGDSIAINGVCLTVTSFTDSGFTADIMPETLKASNIQDLGVGSKVNLERAMAAGGRFGGHFVSGHIDGTGKIITKNSVKNAVYYEIEVDHQLLKHIIKRGSVAVDGTSLTVFEVSQNTFTISLIPLTQKDTVIGLKNAGDIVNIECDMIGKYLSHYLNNQYLEPEPKQSSITPQFLQENGFM